jgi:hypothetical protein
MGWEIQYIVKDTSGDLCREYFLCTAVATEVVSHKKLAFVSNSETILVLQFSLTFFIKQSVK